MVKAYRNQEKADKSPHNRGTATDIGCVKTETEATALRRGDSGLSLPSALEQIQDRG